MKRATIRTGVCTSALALITILNSTARAGEFSLTLSNYLNQVVQRNESMQIRMIETEISRKQMEAQKGVFEPVLVGSFDHEDRRRTLSEEQKLTLLGNPVMNERNKSYESAVELMAPTGTKLRMGYNLRELNNNLNVTRVPGGEYMSTLGMSLTQPLLKDFGTTATMAAIRAAAINSEISFQEYRKTMMEVVARAEAAYWDVYLAQQQFAFATDSVKVANTILQDNRARLGVGKSSELDVMQAEAGVAERQATQNEALQKVHESINRAMVFYSSSSLGTADRLKVVDEPKNEPVDTDVNKYRFLAIDNNPDFLTARKQLKLDDVRIAYAKNQRLPQFDLKGSFGSSGIGGSPRDTFNDIDRAMYPAWTFGVELRLPIGGNIRATKELEAAKLRKETSELTLQTLCVQLDNSIDSARKNAQVFYENTKSFEKVVEFNQNLLNTQLARLEVGKVDSRTVLETEKDLFEAKLGLVQTMIRGKRAIIDLETTVGMTLSSRNLEYTQKQLSERTSALLRASRVTPQALQQYSEMKAREVEARKPAAKP